MCIVSFADDVIAFATGRNIQLIHGPQLHGLIRAARSDGPASLKRTAKRGMNVGGEFWGAPDTLHACRSGVLSLTKSDKIDALGAGFGGDADPT